MSRMLGMLKVLIASLAIAFPLIVVARSFGAGDESPVWLVIFTVSLILGSLFDREGFWGDPHPFRRRAR